MGERDKRIQARLAVIKQGSDISEFMIFEYLLKKVLNLKDQCHTFVKPEITFKSGRLVGMKINPEDHVKHINFDDLK